MKDFKEFKTEIGGKEVTVEIGKYAMQTLPYQERMKIIMSE